MARPDRLTGIRLAALRELPSSALRSSFAQPVGAIDTLTADLLRLWDEHRTDDMSARRIGTLELSSGAYVQWIGYADALVVECSSNAFLAGSSRLTPQEESVLTGAGFCAPDADEPNFWRLVTARDDCATAAWTVVAALTSVFGVYAG